MQFSILDRVGFVFVLCCSFYVAGFAPLSVAVSLEAVAATLLPVEPPGTPLERATMV